MARNNHNTPFLKYLSPYRTSRMWQSFLKTLEDPTKPLMGPNFWILQKIGLVLPENKFKRFLYILQHVIVLMFISSQFAALYTIRSNLDLALTNLKFSMLSLICVMKAFTCIFWQTSWMEVIDYVCVSDEYERQTSDPYRKKILDKYTKHCRNVTYTYWVLVVLTTVTIVVNPFIRYMSSAPYRESIRNGTELFPHVFIAWTPFDVNPSPVCWIIVVWHALLSVYGGFLMAAYDTGAMVILVFFGGKMDLLRERCKQIFRTDNDTVSDEEFYGRIRELHQTHVLYMKYARLFDSLLSPVMFFYMFTWSLLLCASAYQIASATDATQTIVMFVYLIFGVAQLFMFCWHSNEVLVKNEDVMLGPYESEWYSFNAKRRVDILLLAGQFRIKQVFTAGSFANLTVSAFVTILKGSYSYYTLLRK